MESKGDVSVDDPVLSIDTDTDTEAASADEKRPKRPLYRRKGCIACAGVLAALLVAGAVWAGVVEGLWGRYERRSAQVSCWPSMCLCVELGMGVCCNDEDIDALALLSRLGLLGSVARRIDGAFRMVGIG